MLLWLHCPYLIIFTYVYYIHIMWQHPSRFACAGGFSDLTTSSASQDQFPSEKRESEPGPAPQPSMVRPSLALQPNSGTKRCLDHSDMKIEGWRAIFCKLMWLKLETLRWACGKRINVALSDTGTVRTNHSISHSHCYVGFATCFVCRLILRASEDHWQGSLEIMYLAVFALPSHSIYTLHHNSCNLSCFTQLVPSLTLETLKFEQFTLHLPMHLMTLWTSRPIIIVVNLPLNEHPRLGG